jgi:hypothetical protein
LQKLQSIVRNALFAALRFNTKSNRILLFSENSLFFLFEKIRDGGGAKDRDIYKRVLLHHIVFVNIFGGFFFLKK